MVAAGHPHVAGTDTDTSGSVAAPKKTGCEYDV
jgi:hypothetical protein